MTKVLIHSTVSRGTQDVTFTSHSMIAGHKVRITIKSDSYRNQCSAVADVWSPTQLKWNRVVCIPFELMATPDGLYYVKANVDARFVADEKKLVAMATAILA